MPSEPPQAPRAVISGKGRWAGPALAEFRQDHPNWLERFQEAGPVYALLPAATEALRKPPEGQRSILTESQIETELAFYDLCRDFHAIAFWDGRFIVVPYLSHSPPPSKTKQKGLNWSPKQVRISDMLAEKTDPISRRLKGYMGWLVTDPGFIRERDELASQWYALPETSRPYPMVRSLTVSKRPPGSRRASGSVAAFQKALNVFLDRWGLASMPTWDLPEPQGPMFPAKLPADAQAIPKHGLHIVLPTHYPLTGADDLLRQLRQQQATLAQEQGVSASMAGLPHSEAYGQMLDVALIEQTVLSRYGRPKRPRGIMTVIEFVIAEALGMSIHQVQRLRKGIAACRKGKRAMVKWLKVSN